jgi:thiamine-monophosphate kinase
MSEQPPPGEDALIQEFLAPLAAAAPGAHGLLDDCASLTPPPGMDLVLKTDPIRAGIHFFADDDPVDIAWKALAVNVSDLAAKGATPLVYMLGLSFPEYPQRAWLKAFADGLGEAQAAFGCHLTGGDTDRAPGPISIAVTMIGTVPAGRMVPRTGAKPGDALYVTGTIGCAALGLALRGGIAPAWNLTGSERETLVARYLRPQPRLGLGDALRRFASAAMDVSDGLAKDAERLCRASGVSGILRLSDVPLGAAARRLVHVDPALLLRLVTAGDDYEVLCTVPAANEAAFAAAAAHAQVAVQRIGEIGESAGLTVLGQDGTPLTLSRSGWDHFA